MGRDLGTASLLILLNPNHLIPPTPMKVPFMYGALIAIFNAILILVLFFLGYHNDAAKLASLGVIPSIISVIISIVGIALAVRAKRAELPASEKFSYGSAFVTALLTGIIAGLLGAVFYLLYVQLINPELMAVQMQMQSDKLAAKGLSSQQIEQANKIAGFFLKPVIQFLFAAVFSCIFAAITALIVAAFFRRDAAPLHTAPATPPPLA